MNEAFLKDAFDKSQTYKLLLAAVLRASFRGTGLK